MAKPNYSFLDQVLISIDNSLRTLWSKPHAQRIDPAQGLPEATLLPSERKQSGALMRINHTGEVCAQALYYGQALATHDIQVKTAMLQSAQEETDHLAWCEQRILELGDHVSYLNPLWYWASFSLGLLAGIAGDKWSLGFVVETERQVEKHLYNHLQKLPSFDHKSRAILEQMCADEAHHATVAMGAGARELPDPIKKGMKVMSNVMTKVTYYI